MKILKPFLYVLMPLLGGAAIGMYFGQQQYVEELKSGSDNVDAFRWAFAGGLLFSPIGFAIGLIFDSFMWLITNKPKTQNVS